MVVVGEAAFRELTRSAIGPELLLRVYQNAFSEAAQRSGYHIDTMSAGILSAFHERSQSAGEDFLELLLSNSIGSNLDQQDSRTYEPPTRRLRSSQG